MSDGSKYSKSEIESYVKKQTFSDPICGFDHCKRVYEAAKKLGRNYDDEVLHAACFLHDIKALAKDHHLRSADTAEALTKDKLPLHKVLEVREAIKNHGIEGKPKSPEAILLHDADLLDYLGAVGTVRLLMAAKEWYGKQGIYESIKLIKNLKDRISKALILNQSKSRAADLLNTMDIFIAELEEELDGN
jgi:uncharacterized protein